MRVTFCSSRSVSMCLTSACGKGEKSVPLGHKAFAVLRRLVSRPGRLVTKDDLLKAAWPDTAVGEAVLTTAVRELRQVLGDPLHRTGVGSGRRPGGEAQRLAGGAGARVGAARRVVSGGAARDTRIGFVEGEAGIGKTAALDAIPASSFREVLRR
jgi:hypothetical protein